MTDPIHAQFLQNIYRLALRRLFIIKMLNNLIFFAIFAIIIFDFLLITKLTYSISTLHLLLVLFILVLSLAVYKTFVTLPSPYFVLATIDHNAGTRGSFSLLNELTNKEKKNNLVEILYEKCSYLSKSISLKKIFPWEFSWNSYFGASIAFTALLLVAIPKHKKVEKIDLLSEITRNEKSFAIDKKDEIFEKFINSDKTTQPKDAQTKIEEMPKSLLNNKSNTENIIGIEKNQTTTTNEKSTDPEKPKIEETDPTKSKGENSSSGSGNEEKHTDKTITLTKKSGTEANSDIKISLKDGINQDGSSERANTQGNTKDPKKGNTIKLSTDIKSQKMENVIPLVSSKYQKIIERYFSSKD